MESKLKSLSAVGIIFAVGITLSVALTIYFLYIGYKVREYQIFKIRLRLKRSAGLIVDAVKKDPELRKLIVKRTSTDFIAKLEHYAQRKIKRPSKPGKVW